MSKIRRIGTLAASLVLAGGFTFAGAQAASAAPSGTVTLTAAEVQENYAMQEAAGEVTCAFFPSGWGTVCDIASAMSLNNEFQAAAENNCGLRYTWTATGSGLSYDKATYEYTQLCASGGM